MKKKGLLVSFTLGVSLAMSGPAMAAPPAAQQEGFGESVNVNVVNVDVFVTGKDGHPVPGLQKSDFELLEDGKQVDVSYFEEIDRGGAPASQSQAPSAAPSTTPAELDALQLVVYIDNLHIRAAHRARVLRQLREFLNSGLHPGDRVMVVSFDHGLQVEQPFTADRNALARALDEIERMEAYGDEQARARRTALEQTLVILEMSQGISAVADRMAARTPDGSRPGLPGGGPHGGAGGGGSGGGGGGGEGGEDSGGGGSAPVSVDSRCTMDVAEPVRSYAQATRQDVLASIAALEALVRSLSGLPGRKALLHVSDGLPVTPGEELFQALYLLCGGGGAADGAGGLDTSGGLNAGYRAESALIDAQSYSTAKDWSLLAAHANTERVTLYTLQASGLETLSASAADLGSDERYLQLSSVDSVEMQNRQGSLSVMAVDTGGRPTFNTNDIRPDLARLRDDFDHYYSLGFTPRQAGDGREHRLEVRLHRRDLQVRHPRSYRDKSPLESAADRTLAALFYGQLDNPLEVVMEIGDIRPEGSSTFKVPIQLKIPLHKLSFRDNLADLEGKLRLLVATQGPHGEPSRLRQVEIPLKIPRDKALVALGQSYLYELTLTLPAGSQRVAVTVRDEATSMASFLAQDVQVGQKGSTR